MAHDHLEIEARWQRYWDEHGTFRATRRSGHNAAEIDRGADPKIRDQERTLAERLISELSGTEFQPENYEDEYRKRLLKAIEQKIAGQEIERVEVETRAPTTDLVATLKATLGRKALAKAAPTKPEQEPMPSKRPGRRRRAS